MNLDIKYWNPAMMKDGAVVLIIGRRGSGKSTVAEDVLSYKRDTKRGLCVSATERANRFWGKHIPACFIKHEWNENHVKSLFRMQKKVRQKLGETQPAFAIFDDLMFDRTFVRSKQTRKILMNGRHDGIFTLITAQYLMDVPPDLRANIDWVIVLKDNVRANREKIYTYFAGVFPTFAAFDETMKACTNDFECLVIDQTSLSYNISDCIYFYRASPNLQYRIGAREYWDYSQEEEKEEEYDSDSYENRGREVNVKKRYPKRSESPQKDFLK